MVNGAPEVSYFSPEVSDFPRKINKVSEQFLKIAYIKDIQMFLLNMTFI